MKNGRDPPPTIYVKFPFKAIATIYSMGNAHGSQYQQWIRTFSDMFHYDQLLLPRTSCTPVRGQWFSRTILRTYLILV